MIPKYDKVWKLFDGHPERWTKRALARDAYGHEVRPTDDEACKVCMMGAIYLTHSREDRNVIRHLIGTRIGEDVVDFNDAPERTHAEVVALCKELDV